MSIVSRFLVRGPAVGVLFTLCWLVGLAAPVRAADKAAIYEAVKRGVDFLWSQQDRQSGSWGGAEGGDGPSHFGTTSLACLALLECDVPPSDPRMLKAAEFIRQASATNEMTYTYHISLAILFLDRLGDPGDVPLIESLMVRLLSGQKDNGGWGYRCGGLSTEEARRLASVLKQRSELKTTTELPKANAPRRTRRDLPQEIQNQLDVIEKQGEVQLHNAPDDNSNTQFAVFALWVGRRHGLPVDRALQKILVRYQTSQGPDGGWGYYGREGGGLAFGPGSQPTMTCAGLLGITIACGNQVANGNKPVTDLPKEVPAVRGALINLGTLIGLPLEQKDERPEMLIQSRNNGRVFYFLWSLERVAMALDLDRICGKDWYGWGADILLKSQQADGSWRAMYGASGVDTAFGLLFLRRANLAKDLTANLHGKVKDLGKVVLDAGGVGSDALRNRKKPTAINLDGSPIQPTVKSPSKQTEKPTTPPTTVDTTGNEAQRLVADLTEAGGTDQESLIKKYKDAKGIAYTQALAAAIPKLAGATKGKAREALAERMTRMTSATLRDRLEDDNPELRRAAALACAMKEDKAHLAKIADLLLDQEPTVQKAALAALKSLTNQDFGPAADASRADREKAVADWKTWVDKQRDSLIRAGVDIRAYPLFQRCNAIFGVLGVFLYFRLLERLTKLAAQIENLQSETQFRFAAAALAAGTRPGSRTSTAKAP